MSRCVLSEGFLVHRSLLLCVYDKKCLPFKIQCLALLVLRIDDSFYYFKTARDTNDRRNGYCSCSYS